MCERALLLLSACALCVHVCRVRGGDLATQSTQGVASVGVVWVRAGERGGRGGGRGEQAGL